MSRPLADAIFERIEVTHVPWKGGEKDGEKEGEKD